LNNFKYKLSQWRYNAATKFQRFMVGRYGMDDLAKFINILTWISIILSLFNRKFSYVSFILIIVNYLRIFSKKYNKRYNENQLFLKYTKGLRSFFKLTARRIRERKNYRFRTCPNCKKVLRLPNKKGKHTVNCPNCYKPFEVKI